MPHLAVDPVKQYLRARALWGDTVGLVTLPDAWASIRRVAGALVAPALLDDGEVSGAQIREASGLLCRGRYRKATWSMAPRYSLPAV